MRQPRSVALIVTILFWLAGPKGELKQLDVSWQNAQNDDEQALTVSHTLWGVAANFCDRWTLPEQNKCHFLCPLCDTREHTLIIHHVSGYHV